MKTPNVFLLDVEYYVMYRPDYLDNLRKGDIVSIFDTQLKKLDELEQVPWLKDNVIHFKQGLEKLKREKRLCIETLEGPPIRRFFRRLAYAGIISAIVLCMLLPFIVYAIETIPWVREVVPQEIAAYIIGYAFLMTSVGMFGLDMDIEPFDRECPGGDIVVDKIYWHHPANIHHYEYLRQKEREREEMDKMFNFPSSRQKF